MKIDGDWSSAFKLEMKVANIISLQAKHGTQFNVQKSRFGIYVLSERIANIDKDLIPLLPPMMNVGTEYKKPFKLNGDFMVWPKKYCDSVGLERKDVGGPFTAIWYTPFDPSKSAKVKAVMLDMGWIPTEWNIKKQPLKMWTYRKKLERASYANFIKNCSKEDREFYEGLIAPYLEKHFKDKSKGYKQALLTALDFDLEKKIPTFGDIKKRLLLRQFWPSSPKITEDSFDSLDTESSHALHLLKERMIWSHRRSLLVGLNENIRPDGKLSGEANPCATPTARMRHKIIVNIPAAGAPFGKECRSMFTGDYNGKTNHFLVRGKNFSKAKVDAGLARRKGNTNICEILDKKSGKWEEEGYCYHYIPRGYNAFVGGDGAGLELRMLTHYLIAVSKMLLDEAKAEADHFGIEKYQAALDSAYEYRDVLLNGDIHSHNQRLAGLPTRKAAKTFIYAFLYGAGDANLGGQLGGDRNVGAELRATFLRECPCIPVLIEWIQGFAKANGWVPAIDGRKLMMRRDADTGEVMAHKALNTLLQAAGSIVMKYSMCYLDGWVRKEKLDCHQVIMMHDEFQYTCNPAHVARLREMIDSCVAKAGVALKMECELASDSLCGANWYHTH